MSVSLDQKPMWRGRENCNARAVKDLFCSRLSSFSPTSTSPSHHVPPPLPSQVLANRSLVSGARLLPLAQVLTRPQVAIGWLGPSRSRIPVSPPSSSFPPHSALPALDAMSRRRAVPAGLIVAGIASGSPLDALSRVSSCARPFTQAPSRRNF